MNRGRACLVPPPGASGSPLEQRASEPKPNRLRRSLRRTQQTQTAVAESPEGREPDFKSGGGEPSNFKTPTRIPRSRPVGGLSGDSPHNDSDFQQDIIWDATSPSPGRLGKRGKKQQAAVAVNISEIVRRIAPKSGRPKVAEPTLEQWIGDSATIPCTPDVQVPRPKKKSPRPNGVDDLLKLAKQLDFNMFQQDGEEVEDLHQQSPELLYKDILDFKSSSQNCVSASTPGNSEAVRKDAQERLDRQTDFLFDGPTQRLSVNLSQASSAQPRPAPLSRETSGNPSLHGPSGVSTTNSKATSRIDEFEDDWENDDLLNDSLLLEMTQNPQNFSAPKHCSTQKPARGVKSPPPVNVPISGGIRVDQSAGWKVEKESLRRRMTFRLDSNPSFSVKRIQADTAEKDTQQFSSRKGFSVQLGSRQTCQSNTEKSDPQKSQFHQRTSASSFVLSVSSTKPETVSSCYISPAACDVQDEDLESFFSSELVWDDLDDDNLLCEMCENMENQIHSVEISSGKEAPPVGRRTALQPSNRTWDSRNWQPPSGRGAQKQTPPSAAGRPAGGSLGAASVSNVAAGFRCTQTKTASGSSSTYLQGSSGAGPAAAGRAPASKDQFTFKKPNNLVSTVTSNALGKCSAAEIEMKKQQAMERRRQRLQATQNLRALT